MKTKVKIVIILMTLTMILINIATISANENMTDTPTKNNDTTQQISRETTKNIRTDTAKSVYSYQQLYDTIEEAKKTGTSEVITLEEGDYNITSPIEIRGQNSAITITINGQYNIINGQSTANFISIAKSNALIINNLTIENTNATAGSAIYSKGNVNITNIQFKNCYSQSWISNCGGAIYNSGNMSINNSTFTNNTIVTDTFGGGAIFNNGVLTVKNSNFHENNAMKGSAIFSLKSKTDLTNSTFTCNHANNTATIYNFNSTVNITDCLFNSNTAINSSILEAIDNSMTIICNTTMINHRQSKNIINNQAKTSLNNCNISDNKQLQNMIVNTDELDIINSNITHNDISNLIENEAYLTIEESDISYNNATDYIIRNDIEYDDIISSVNLTNFNSNNAQSVLYDLNSTMLVYDSIFTNNTSYELFNGTTDTFKTVTNNTYLSNNLSSQIESEDYVKVNYDEDISFNAYIKALPIYNTTVDSGIVSVYDEDELIGIFNVTGGISSITLANTIIEEKTYKLSYTDKPNYQNSTADVHIKSLIPEFEIKINTSDYNISYDDILNCSIIIKNVGEGNSSNIYIENLLPDDVKTLYCNDENYDVSADSWFIERLDSMDECILNLSLEVKRLNDFNISIEIAPVIGENPIIFSQEIHVLRPNIYIDISNDTGEMILRENYTLPLTIRNCGDGLSNNTLIYVTDDEGNVTLYESGIIDANSSKTLNINKTATHIGENILQIKSVESLTNQTKTGNISLNVRGVSIIIPDVTAYHEDSLNLTATVENASYLTDECICIFKINGLTVKNHDMTIKDNKIILENFTVPDNWSKDNYTLEVKVLDKGFDNVIINRSTINIVKRNIISIVDDVKALPGDMINLTAVIYTTDAKAVNHGYVKFKINGRSINQTAEVHNASVCLIYRIPDTYRGSNYTISLVYGENRMYCSNRNSSILTLESQECEIDIRNSTYTKGNDYHINATIHGKKNGLYAYSGKAVFKLNGKTFTDVIYVKDGFVNCTIVNLDIKGIDNITICYSGNNVLSGTRKTVTFI